MFIIMLTVSLFAEVLVNNRALVVKYEGHYFFPTYKRMLPGTTFGESYNYETNYRKLAERFKSESNGNWVLLPPVPFNPYENDLRDGTYLRNQLPKIGGTFQIGKQWQLGLAATGAIQPLRE
jgi:microcin C transport system permease protein